MPVRQLGRSATTYHTCSLPAASAGGCSLAIPRTPWRLRERITLMNFQPAGRRLLLRVSGERRPARGRAPAVPLDTRSRTHPEIGAESMAKWPFPAVISRPLPGTLLAGCGADARSWSRLTAAHSSVNGDGNDRGRR